jgi:hypothetical protein
MLLAAADLRGVVVEWDVANDARSADPVEQRLRQALRQIANAESGAWGWIGRDALDDRGVRSNRDIGAHRDGVPATPDAAIAGRGQGPQARR